MFNLKEVLMTPLKKNKVYRNLIENVGREAGWIGKTSMLAKRLKKIFHNHHLSVRDKYALTKMYKLQVKQNKLDWESILYEFPGKTMIFVQEF